MCGTPNHGDAEECTNCGARLKPLQVGGDSKDSEDWLDRIRDEAEEPSASMGAEGPASEESAADDDFELDFDELRAAEADSGSAPEAESAGDDVPEWLQRIREKKAEEPTDLPASDEPAPEDALRTAAAAGQVTDEPIDSPISDEPLDDLRAAATACPSRG